MRLFSWHPKSLRYFPHFESLCSSWTQNLQFCGASHGLKCPIYSPARDRGCACAIFLLPLQCSCRNRMVKKCKANLRLPSERTHSKLRKAPPLDGYGRLPLHPFYGQPLYQVWIRLAIKGTAGVVGQTHHVGALYDALNLGVLMAAWDLPCIFFLHPPNHAS